MCPMSYIVTKYPHGTFCWADFFSTDIQNSKAFYEGLFNWTSEDMPTGEGMPDYTMFSLDGHNTAGGSPVFSPDMPSFWSNYITVRNVNETVQIAKELGATITMEPMDVLDSGRMATIQDPTGAQVSLWQPKKHIGAGIVNTVGSMCWNELYTPDLEKAKTFYHELLGWTYEIEKETGYVTIKNDDRMNGGMMELTEEMKKEGMNPCWMVYFTVHKLDEAIEKVKSLGGNVYMTKDIGVGKIAMIADPAHCHNIIMEMAVTPEEWINTKE